MNILFTGFNKGLSSVPSLIKKRININDVHLIVDSRNDISTECKNYLITRSCQLGNFSDLEKYSDIPLDENLLIEMSKCESIVIKMMDRYQFTKKLLLYEQRINLYHKQLKYWVNYLLKEKIHICVFSVIPHVVFDMIIYYLCKYLGIKTIMLYRLPVLLGKNVSVYLLNDINDHISNLKRSYNFYLLNPELTNLSQRIASYLDLKQGNSGKTFTGVSSKKFNIWKYFNIINYVNFFNYFIPWAKSWMILWGNPVDIFYRGLYKFSMTWKQKPVFQNNPDLTCPYIFVSLHYQPECTTSPMGGVFVHQDLMIEILMKTIPKHLKIYVKAHPRNGISSIIFRRLQVDSRTILINPKLNSFNLIINSLATATITGTAGWEAFLNNKPVLIFGNYFYQDAPGVYKIRTVIDSENAISKIIAGNNVISDDMIIAFLKAVDENTFPGWVDNRYATMSNLTEEENCKNITDHLVDKIKEI